MSTNRNHGRFSISFTLLIVLIYPCSYCMAVDDSSNSNYFPATATYYGSPSETGSGASCGMANDDVSNDPYNGFVSAGNHNLFKSGSGCGTCYEVKCMGQDNPACSGRPVKVTITEECPTCNESPFHFDLSIKAFGALANPGQDNNLKNAGIINLQYRRVKCNYRTNVKFRIDEYSNKTNLAFVVENLNGYGDIAYVEAKPSNANWLTTQRSYGVIFKFGILEGLRGPYSIRITGPENNTSITAVDVIPHDWSVGVFYNSTVNF